MYASELKALRTELRLLQQANAVAVKTDMVLLERDLAALQQRFRDEISRAAAATNMDVSSHKVCLSRARHPTPTHPRQTHAISMQPPVPWRGLTVRVRGGVGGAPSWLCAKSSSSAIRAFSGWPTACRVTCPSCASPSKR
jgi:hypothetical protein